MMGDVVVVTAAVDYDLGHHADVREMTEEIRSGSIDVHPSYVSESDNACRNCPYHQICRFEEGENGEFSNPTPRLDDETVWAQLQEET